MQTLPVEHHTDSHHILPSSVTGHMPMTVAAVFENDPRPEYAEELRGRLHGCVVYGHSGMWQTRGRRGMPTVATNERVGGMKLEKDTETYLLNSIKRFFDEEMEMHIGDLKAMQILDFFVGEMGPSIYNQAICRRAGVLRREGVGPGRRAQPGRVRLLEEALEPWQLREPLDADADEARPGVDDERRGYLTLDRDAVVGQLLLHGGEQLVGLVLGGTVHHGDVVLRGALGELDGLVERESE